MPRLFDNKLAEWIQQKEGYHSHNHCSCGGNIYEGQYCTFGDPYYLAQWERCGSCGKGTEVEKGPILEGYDDGTDDYPVVSRYVYHPMADPNQNPFEREYVPIVPSIVRTHLARENYQPLNNKMIASGT